MTWGTYASATDHLRYKASVETRKLCWCGCRLRATHAGFANGMALTAPLCELAVRRWVKTGDVRSAAVPRS